MKMEKISVKVKKQTVWTEKLVAEDGEIGNPQIEAKLRALFPKKRAKNLCLAALNYGTMLWARNAASAEDSPKKKIALAEQAVSQLVGSDPVLRDAYFDAFKDGVAAKDAFLLDYYEENLKESAEVAD